MALRCAEISLSGIFCMERETSTKRGNRFNEVFCSVYLPRLWYEKSRWIDLYQVYCQLNYLDIERFMVGQLSATFRLICYET